MTRAELDNPADLWANIAKTILTTDSPAFPYTVYGHRVLGAMDNNRVEIIASGFARASDHMDMANISGASTPFYNDYTGRLAFAVVGSRADANANANFGYCVGRIGTLARRDQQKWNVNICQGLGIVALDELDMGTPSVSEKTDLDRMTRHFGIRYVIPAAVYSAAT